MEARINQVVLSAAAYSAGWTKTRGQEKAIGKLDGLTFLRRKEGGCPPGDEGQPSVNEE